MKSISSLLRTRTHYLNKASSQKGFSSGTSKPTTKIQIPNRIPRGPTDILQALASTIKRDPTAAHYKYHDDPYLMPMSNVGKRTFALAQESGRKTAQWIRQEHADLFQHSVADPSIKAFIPKINYSEDSDVSEEDLKNVIKEVFISDAILIYNLLKNKNQELSNETKQAVLELLCYYNSQDTLEENLIEERWFKQGTKGKERLRKTWKDGTTAEEIFSSLENKDAAAYCAIIQGMAKYCQADRAWELFQESQNNGVLINTDTYNAIIRIGPFLKEAHEMRWTFVQDILNMLASRKDIVPNLGTMNSVLEVLSGMLTYRNTKTYMLAILAEFKALGIEPSLATWYHVLNGFCKDRGRVSTILMDIMNEIEHKHFEIRDLKDVQFFVTAMEICRHHLNDAELAHRVHNLLQTGNNYDLIGDSFKESVYYRHYFALLCTSEPLESFMANFYNKFVPNIYIPEPGVMEEVLKAVEVEGAVNYIPKLWSDIVMFDQSDREGLITMMLDIMVNNEPPAESELIERFTKIALDIWERVNGQHEEKRNKLNFTGPILANIITICLRGERFDMALTVMDKLDKEQHTVVGLPSVDALCLFVDHCIQNKMPTKAINCIQYCADCGFSEATHLANKLNESLTLDEEHQNKLTNIVGSHVLKHRSNN